MSKLFQLIVRIVAVGLMIPVVLLIWWPAIYVLYDSSEQHLATMAFLFRIFIIGLAIGVFASLPARRSAIQLAPGFLAFSLAASFNPFEVAWQLSRGSYCPERLCEDVTFTEVAKDFLHIWAPLVPLEFTAFVLLFVLVRIAAGKMWPGRVIAKF